MLHGNEEDEGSSWNKRIATSVLRAFHKHPDPTDIEGLVRVSKGNNL